METSERLNLVAPCGIDCGICELYTCKDNTQLFDQLVAKGISKDIIPCKGCRPTNGKCPLIQKICETFNCISKKKLNFCYECNDFPCLTLHPSADRANKLPHNMKMYNLCTIKKEGVENFVKKSSEIKNRYFAGTMAIGKGPQI
ncbi:MAG TPA: DUF3795 domain-containing protein [Bacteroidales bacterium]|nr:DUF3795 domain-containing protein [Bacteroidales bacterium]HPS17901.1 DUF3795 domain-containing protein [Bacteroidales bacterium]